MSKYTKQDTIEEDGRKLFQDSLDSNFFLVNDFSAPAGKDRYPDIDGQLRLRDGNGNYLDLYLHYQLKSTGDLHAGKYRCDGNIIDYLLSTNIPTLLFVADTTTKKVYWFFLSEDQKRKLQLSTSGNSSKTLDLTSNLITTDNNLQINQLWRKFAKEDNFTKLNDAINKIDSSFHIDIQKCLGLLYLLQRVSQSELIDIFHQLLRIEKSDIEIIIRKLVQEGVVSTTANFYLIDNEQLGIESLHKLLLELNLSSLEERFENKKDRKRILRQLAKINHETAQEYLSKLSDNLLELVKNPTNNDELFLNLELLDEYAFRVPQKAVAIIRAISTAKPLPPTITELKGFGLIEDKSHQDLILKCIDILDRIRYHENDVFGLLLEFSKNEIDSVKNHALKVIEHLSKYNLHVLRQFGYVVQMFILERMESWNNDQLIEAKDAAILICKELLSPSFEDTSMKDYKTFTFHSGALNPTSDLIDIRRRSLEVMKKLYSLLQDLVIKKNILDTIQKATQTPISSNYGTDMEQMVLDNTNSVIEYYLSILSSAENDLVKDIDKQTDWFSRRFGQEKLTRLGELKNKITFKTEYDMFKVFVGYDVIFNDGMNWDKSRENRLEKIQEFITEISEANLADWEAKILTVIKNYSSSEPGEFQYFNTFLFEFAKKKPNLALSFLYKRELEPFLIYLIAGVWNSSLQKKAKDIVSDWMKEGKYLSISASLFCYVESVDGQLLKNIYEKARSVKDIEALNNIIYSIIKHYPQHKNLKTLFIKTVMELTKNKDYRWINNVWYRAVTILNNLNENDFDIILKNLLLLPNIEYHAAEILIPVAEKYPEKIIAFFYKRIVIKSKREKNLNDRYDAIPFDFHNFHKIIVPLRKHESTILPSILALYSKGNANNRWYFWWDLSHLLEEVFPNFSPAMEKALIEMIRNDSKSAIDIIMSILSKFQGQDFLWGVVKAVVAKHSDSKKYEKIKDMLFSYLSQTKVVAGEYGFVDALQGKKQQLQKFKSDPDEVFKEFIRDYEIYLEQSIEYEQKRADEKIEFRKRKIND